MKKRKDELNVPIWEKINLTIDEAAAYSNIGENRIRSMTDDPRCTFVLWIGERNRLVKRKEFEQYLSKSFQV